MIPRSPCALKSAIRIRRPALTWFCFVFRRRTANFLATASCLLFNLSLPRSSSDDDDATFIFASFYCVYFKYDFHCYGIFCTMRSMLAGMLIQGKRTKKNRATPKRRSAVKKVATMLPCFAGKLAQSLCQPVSAPHPNSCPAPLRRARAPSNPPHFSSVQAIFHAPPLAHHRVLPSPVHRAPA